MIRLKCLSRDELVVRWSQNGGSSCFATHVVLFCVVVLLCCCVVVLLCCAVLCCVVWWRDVSLGAGMIVLSTVAIKMEGETIDKGCHGVVAFRSSCLFPVLIWDDENENSSLVSQKTKPQTLNGIGPTNDLPGVNSRVGTISLTQKPQEKIYCCYCCCCLLLPSSLY